MKDKHPIDNLFRENLSSHKMTPPATAWEAIEGNINHKKTKSRSIYLYSAIAASICLLCASTITFTSHNNNPVVQRSNPEIHQIEKGTLSKLNLDSDKKLQFMLPGHSSPTKPRQTSTIAHSSIEIEESMAIESERFSVGIQTMKREIFVSVLNPSDLTLDNSQFMVPSYNSLVREEAPKGRRFRFLQSVVSVAKGVQSGQKTLSGLRKSKIEFIQEDLKYGSEKESEVEATIDELPPSYQK